MEQKELIHRLNRVQGQIDAIRKMIENNEPDCIRVMQLLKASTNALKKFGEAYMQEHLHTCLQDNMPKEEMNQKMKDVIVSVFSFS